MLQFGWDAAKHKGGRGVAAPNEGEDSHQFGVDIAVVDEAIKSQLFWARLKMLESLAIVLRKCLAWAEVVPVTQTETRFCNVKTSPNYGLPALSGAAGLLNLLQVIFFNV